MQSRIYDPSRLQADKTEGLNDRPGTNFMDARPKELELMNQIKYLNQENLYSQTISIKKKIMLDNSILFKYFKNNQRKKNVFIKAKIIFFLKNYEIILV